LIPNFLTLTGKSALLCFYPLALFFDIAAIKKTGAEFFHFPAGRGMLIGISNILCFFYLAMKRDLGNSSRVKNIFACVNGNFFALGKTSKGWFSILNSDCQSVSLKFRRSLKKRR